MECLSVGYLQPEVRGTSIFCRVSVLCRVSLVQMLKWSYWSLAQSHRYHYNDVIMSAMASQITGVFIGAVASGADQGKHQSSASLAFMRGIHRSPVNSPHKRPVTRKMFPYDDVIMMMPFVIKL